MPQRPGSPPPPTSGEFSGSQRRGEARVSRLYAAADRRERRESRATSSAGPVRGSHPRPAGQAGRAEQLEQGKVPRAEPPGVLPPSCRAVARSRALPRARAPLQGILIAEGGGNCPALPSPSHLFPSPNCPDQPPVCFTLFSFSESAFAHGHTKHSRGLSKVTLPWCVRLPVFHLVPLWFSPLCSPLPRLGWAQETPCRLVIKSHTSV